MRPNLLPILALGYLFVGLQSGLSAHLRLAGIAPNLVLALAAYVALLYSRQGEILACVGIGMLQDLATAQPFGLFALTYGLLALLVQSIGPIFRQDHPASLSILTILGGLIWLVIVFVHDLRHPPGGPVAFGSPIRSHLAAVMLATLWTAILAPLIVMILNRVWTLATGDRHWRLRHSIGTTRY
jgi:rod shape-determining protein MreD